MEATVYLANKPTGTILAFLIVALIAFGFAGFLAYTVKALWATIVCVGLVFFVLAFIVSG